MSKLDLYPLNPLERQSNSFMLEMGWKTWSQKKIAEKIKEEAGEVAIEVRANKNGKLKVEIGDLLFAIARLCAKKHISMNEALQESLAKFRARDKDRYKKVKKKKSRKK